MDPHAVLGVARGASDEEIKAAYRAAAMRWHPDRNASMDAAAASVAEERFKRVSDAYERLSGGNGHGAGVGGASSRYQNHGRGQTGRRESGRYYGGADDPFGFRAREHVTGDTRRRVDRNLRVLYVSLAFVGMAIYLAPTAPSPAEMSRARRRREASTRKREASRFSSSSSSSSSSSTSTVVDKATNRLALGSPLFAAGASSDRDRYLGESELRASLRGGGEEGPEWASGGYAGRGIRRRVLPYHARGRGRMRSRHAEDVRADARGADADDDDEARDAISTRCARCGHELPLVRRCPVCGAPTTRPDSVVVATRAPTGVPTGVPARVPIADAQDTGSNVGRGRERARAAAAAAAAAAATAEPPKPAEPD